MEFDLFKEIKPNCQKALFLAKRQLVEFVYDAVNLEGINYTLPEVQTLLDGVTIGGHKLSDQCIALNQADAWHFLFQNIQNQSFSLNQSFVCQLHFEAAKEEELSWGAFRTGQVTISGTDYMPPKAEVLADMWQQVIFDYHEFDGFMLYQQAIGLFLDMARIQFFL